MSAEGTIKPFKNQVWKELRSQYNRENLFEDPEFPANDASLFYSQPKPEFIDWKRPKDVMDNPQFFVDHFDRADLDQGYLGNCWFIAGAVGIMQSEKCFARVVPRDQDYDADYGGIFHFRFWKYGEWVDVVIDDRLPFYSDGSGRLVFCSNKQQPNELWGPLLEKAYAKLYGSYENLNGGFTTDSLIDMSGGIAEGFDLTKMDDNDKKAFWHILYQAYNKRSIIGCSLNDDPNLREARLPNGLVCGHAYTITKVAKITVNGVVEKLIRCRNPWGNEVEWNSEWSDNSAKWNSVSAEVKRELGLVKDHDGEFWMDFGDFKQNWHTVQICHLGANDVIDELLEMDDDNKLKWKCTIHHSSWKAGSTAGGCGSPNTSKFWTNPQFYIKLTDVDRDDRENMATLVVALMQKDARLKRLLTGGEAAEEYIQFRIFKILDGVPIDENKSSGLKLYANQLERIGTSDAYINMREVTQRFRVPPGDYLIIPSTFAEDVNCDFMLRLFTEQLIEHTLLNTQKTELNDDDVQVEYRELDILYDTHEVPKNPHEIIPETQPAPVKAAHGSDSRIGSAKPQESASRVGSAKPNESASRIGSAKPQESASRVGSAKPNESASRVGSAKPHESASRVGSARHTPEHGNVHHENDRSDRHANGRGDRHKKGRSDRHGHFGGGGKHVTVVNNEKHKGTREKCHQM